MNKNDSDNIDGSNVGERALSRSKQDTLALFTRTKLKQFHSERIGAQIG